MIYENIAQGRLLVTAGDPVEKVEVGGNDYHYCCHHHDHDHQDYHNYRNHNHGNQSIILIHDNFQVGAGQQLEIQRAAMPDQFDQMMEEVTR